MAKVCYLIGAGASAQCVPVVNGMKDDMAKLRKELSEYFPTNITERSLNKDLVEKYDQIIKTLDHLEDVCDRYYSIDTYAKKLYLTKRTLFSALKLDLCLYFTLRQIVTNPDKRYDNFFASIITSDNKLPSKINIISWNYDFQIEKSYSEFNSDGDIEWTRSKLGIMSPKHHEWYINYTDCFNTVKLNGSARITTKDYEGYMFESFAISKHEMIMQVTDKYLQMQREAVVCELKFAWENDNYSDLFKAAATSLSAITVLVIVGYSFPFFNREVDNALFNKMINLSKIYIQDCNPEAIHERMKEFVTPHNASGRIIEYVYKDDLTQFVYPKELDVVS